jgi:hypothetical protein
MSLLTGSGLIVESTLADRGLPCACTLFNPLKPGGLALSIFERLAQWLHLFTNKLLLNNYILILPSGQVGVAAALKSFGGHDLIIVITHSPASAVPSVHMVLKRDHDVLAGRPLRSSNTPVLPKCRGANNGRRVDSLPPV